MAQVGTSLWRKLAQVFTVNCNINCERF